MKWAKGHEPIRDGPRCAYCHKAWRRAKYDPFCSYHCQEWTQMDKNLELISLMKQLHEARTP